MTTDALTEVFGEPISVYTRSQAIEDGMLIDVTSWAREAGINAPTVITAALWGQVDIDTRNKETRRADSTRGRAHDVLYLAAYKLRVALKDGDTAASYKCRFGRADFNIFAMVDTDGVTIGFPEDF